MLCPRRVGSRIRTLLELVVEMVMGEGCVKELRIFGRQSRWIIGVILRISHGLYV